MIRCRCLPLRQGFVGLLIVAGPARSDLAGNAAREVAERLGRGVRGTASCRAARHVDDVARPVTPHRVVRPPLVPLARSSSRTLATLTPRNARRLAMLAEDGTLARSGRWGELMAVIERHGDRAMDFVWRHKGALAVTTALGAFLAEPEAFLGGGRELSPQEGRSAVRPPVDVAGSGVVRLLGVVPRVIPMGLGLVAALAVVGPLLRTVGKLRRRPMR